MWTTEHSVETTAEPEAIWRCWADVARWPDWNADLARAELSGAFIPGSTIRMTSVAGEVVELRIAEAVESERFVDEAEFGGVTVRTHHRIEQIDPGRRRIVYRLEISGPGSDRIGPELGPQISGDFPDTLASLAERAEH
jgi:uncharacterized protein YndB with AHSA1/START domain